MSNFNFTEDSIEVRFYAIATGLSLKDSLFWVTRYNSKHGRDIAIALAAEHKRLEDVKIKLLEETLEKIWLELEPGKSDISNISQMRINIGNLIMNVLNNKELTPIE